MPEKKTPSGIIVPVPELSREERCALAFASAGGKVGELPAVKVDPTDVDPVNTAVARALLLEVAAKAIERAIEGAASQYREAMRDKYALMFPEDQEADEVIDAEYMPGASPEERADKEVAIAGMEHAHKKTGIFRR